MKSNNKNESKALKKGFFKKVWYSIFKLEKYGEMSAEGVVRSLTYLIKLALIVAIIISLGTIYQINEVVNKGIDFLNEQVGEFNYKDGILQIEKNEPIKAPSSTFGEIIIDTNIENKEEINQYLNTMENNRGILVLKDKVLIKGFSDRGTISYDYKTVLDGINIYEANKQQVIEYVNGNNTWKVYLFIFVLLLGYSLINTLLPIIFNTLLLGIFGYIATWFAKIKMRFVAIFNLAAYSLTLSILLHAIYVGVNIFVDFNIKYFQIMYIAVAAIYLIASIFLIKAEFIKRQVQLAKEAQEKLEEFKQKNKEEQEDKDDQKDENEKNQDKDEKKKKEGKDTNNDEPEGSEA